MAELLSSPPPGHQPHPPANGFYLIRPPKDTNTTVSTYKMDQPTPKRVVQVPFLPSKVTSSPTHPAQPFAKFSPQPTPPPLMQSQVHPRNNRQPPAGNGCTPTPSPSFVETYYGFVKDRRDASILVEACVSGVLKAVKVAPARMSVRSGTVLVFAETTGVLTRWRDGITWSPSRVHGSFLLYREVQPVSNSSAKEHFSSTQMVFPRRPLTPTTDNPSTSYFSVTNFRPNTHPVPDGLAKRTITITGSDGARYRVISYFYPYSVQHLFPSNTSAHNRINVDIDIPSCVPALLTPSRTSWLEAFVTAADNDTATPTTPVIPSQQISSAARNIQRKRHLPVDAVVEEETERMEPVKSKRIRPVESQAFEALPCSISFLID